MSYVCICCDKTIEIMETDEEKKGMNPKEAVMLLSYAAYGSKFDFGKQIYNYDNKVNMFFMCDDCYEKNISKAIKYSHMRNHEIEPATIQ
tara:strand:- start:131 stop:400 length:270 start_codon:yes stop_codon:yes gene_type:complete